MLFLVGEKGKHKGTMVDFVYALCVNTLLFQRVAKS